MAEQTGPRGQSKKPWLTYDLRNDENKREQARKLLSLTQMLKELGYPTRMYFTSDSLMPDDKSLETLGITKDLVPDIGIIEFLPVDQKIAEEIIQFVEGRKIRTFGLKMFTYEDKTEVCRLFVMISSIKK